MFGWRTPTFTTCMNCSMCSGGGELHLFVCRLLCGDLHPGNLRPPQRQHHAEDQRSHVPHRLREVPGTRTDVRKHQTVSWIRADSIILAGSDPEMMGSILMASSSSNALIVWYSDIEYSYTNNDTVTDVMWVMWRVQGPRPLRLHLRHGVCHQRRRQTVQPLPRLCGSVLRGVQPDQETHTPVPQPAGPGGYNTHSSIHVHTHQYIYTHTHQYI